MIYEEFRKRCNTLGLSARKCHETHWQILIEGDPLVNLWPTTNRWAPANNKPGTKAQRGGIVPALAWCKKYVDGCPTKPRLPHELVTEVPLYDESSTRWDFPADDHIAAIQAIIADRADLLTAAKAMLAVFKHIPIQAVSDYAAVDAARVGLKNAVNKAEQRDTKRNG